MAIMTNNDILRAAAGLHTILDEAYATELYGEAREMNHWYKDNTSVPVNIQVRHLKYELEQIPKFLAEGTQSEREKALRWLSDVGGVMRSELDLVSITELGNLFRPEADTADADKSPRLPISS